MTKKQDELLNSNYDGIQEYDNDLPRWWLGIFYITIAFGLVYGGYKFLHMGPNSEDALALELKAIKDSAQVLATEEPSNQALLARVKDSARVAAGHEVFIAKCAPCHAPDAGGLVGPNLTDEYWIHGGKMIDMYRTVNKGVLEKGMLAWKGVLPDDQIQDVVAYIRTLKGTTPAIRKDPQGDKYTGDE